METLTQQQSEIFREVDRLRISAKWFDRVNPFNRTDRTGQDGTDQNDSVEPNDPLHSATPNDHESHSSVDAEKSIESRARQLIRSDKFRSQVGYAILDENWAGMFPEAIQAKSVGVVTRSLFESGGNEELINDTHLMAWVIFLMTSPDNTVKQP